MNSESSYFKLGLFVIAGLALIVVGVVIFGAGALFTEYLRVETATTESVQGLDVGAAVKYQGVPIGKVAKIEMASWRYRVADPSKQSDVNRYIRIEMDFRRDMLHARNMEEIHKNLERAIQHGLRARMASSGLTGPVYLEILYLDPQRHPVQPVPWTPPPLYLPSAPSTRTEIVTGVEAILAELKKAQLGTVAADLGRLINNTDQAIVDLKTAVLREKAASVLDEARGAARRVREILANPNIDRTIDDLSATMASANSTLSGDDVQAFVADLPKISSRLRDTTARIDEIVRDPKMQKLLDGLSDTATSTAPAAAELRRALRELNLLLSTQRQDLEAIVANLRRVLENGAALVEDAKSNPSRAIFGEPPPRVQIGGDR